MLPFMIIFKIRDLIMNFNNNKVNDINNYY